MSETEHERIHEQAEREADDNPRPAACGLWPVALLPHPPNTERQRLLMPPVDVELKRMRTV